MKIALANDHAAIEARTLVKQYLVEQGHELLDFGVDTNESVDYPDQARRAVQAVQEGLAELAVVMCGTGIGVSISANKFKGIRCALCTDEYAAEMARAHNNANAIALRSREIDPALNLRILERFLATEFEGDRHQRRLDLIHQFEDDEQAPASGGGGCCC